MAATPLSNIEHAKPLITQTENIRLTSFDDSATPYEGEQQWASGEQ
jgi:hypothetical protein